VNLIIPFKHHGAQLTAPSLRGEPDLDTSATEGPAQRGPGSSGTEKNIMMVLFGYFLIAVITVTSSAATAYSQVSLDDEIQRLREGKEITISDADFLKARTDRHDKFLEFAADLYIEQIKWSLISPKKHGGWPVRSFVVEEPDWIADIDRVLRKKPSRPMIP
jgi:hypothetical protein